jgi:hypothetical protein
MTKSVLMGVEDSDGVIPQALWIFGDNILECEQALSLVVEAVGSDPSHLSWVGGALYAPLYEISIAERVIMTAQLFPGYHRWDYDLQLQLRQRGAPLLEATDAVVVDAATREIVLAFEFCGALPAGNNAWQRCGRALAAAKAGVPYLYYAELGGIELDRNRKIKAARFPNPIVPFAYLSLSQLSNSLAAPVFDISPSGTADVAREFAQSNGAVEALDVIRELLLGDYDYAGAAVVALQQKADKTVHALADRRRNDTLVGDEWHKLAEQRSGNARVDWLLARGMPWSKTQSIGTPSFREFLSAVEALGTVAAGAESIPISLLAADKRGDLANIVSDLYRARVTSEFLEWLSAGASRPLILVWIAGFKPTGEDSRPDRGLLPLAHMLFSDGADYLSIVYGPARPAQLAQLETDSVGLARSNGLWEALVGLSDAIIIDGQTSDSLSSIGVLTPELPPESDRPAKPFDSSRAPTYGEQDIDTILHMLFATDASKEVFEGMCNPPGGNWSGISFQAAMDRNVVRWTSLPRVTKKGSKRPDHVVVIQGGEPTVLSIESKQLYRTVETGVGPRLNAYVEGLFKEPPTIWRRATEPKWKPFTQKWSCSVRHFSAVAYQHNRRVALDTVRAGAQADIVFALEFRDGTGECVLHMLSTPAAREVLRRVHQLALRFGNWLEVQEH